MNKFKKIFTGKESEHETNHGNTHSVSYQCPMKCEGDKTYDAPGNCPVCNMHLAPVNAGSHTH